VRPARCANFHRRFARIGVVVEALTVQPRPEGAKKLRGLQAWRVKVNEYRVIYEIQDAALVVTVIRVAHRRDAYRGI
jgi:mRNA interferase RelE/StbE